MPKPSPRQPRLVTPVPPRAYELTNCGLPFSRNTLYRWEKLKLIKLLRVASKTLISAETVEDILAGRIALPRNAGMTKPPMSRARQRKAEQQTSAAAE
jgi:hypothetical protein